MLQAIISIDEDSVHWSIYNQGIKAFEKANFTSVPPVHTAKKIYKLK